MSGSHFDVIIIGAGLAGLSAAARLRSDSEKLRILIAGSGSGASPYIAALNAVLQPNPFGDSVEQHINDTLEMGYHVNDPDLVRDMCLAAPRCVELLQDWGVGFSLQDERILRRRTSGSTFPRALFQKSGLLGIQAQGKLRQFLVDRNVTFLSDTVCHQLVVSEGAVQGAVFCQPGSSKFEQISAPVIMAAWGGIGNLFPGSTYPFDIDGRTLGMAFEAGAKLIDLEFVEFEPTVVTWPPKARGELLPTALLNDGTYLLNREQERFMLKIRPEAESGCGKTVLNQAIWREISEGRGSRHGGVYADLRHLPLALIKGYPWFYERLSKADIDFGKDLIDVGPMPHSHSGGLMVTRDCQTNLQGLYGIGEAAGGIHGACRLGGNAATQALVSGVVGAEGILARGFNKDRRTRIDSVHPAIDPGISRQLLPRTREIVGRSLGPRRDKETLNRGLAELGEIIDSKQAAEDDLARQSALSGWLMVQSSLKRTESRGNHFRSDYPITDPGWQCSVELRRSAHGEIIWKKIPRPQGKK